MLLKELFTLWEETLLSFSPIQIPTYSLKHISDGTSFLKNHLVT